MRKTVIQSAPNLLEVSYISWFRTAPKKLPGRGFESLTHYNMKQKDYHKPGYWKDWYWNKGGREKVQAKRYIAEYGRERRRARTSVD